MEILEATSSNFDSLKDDLIALNNAFLKSLNIFEERTLEKNQEILQKMIAKDSPTHLFVILSKEGKRVGMTYINKGTGYSCGGDYLWLNSIYVMPEYQKNGFGRALLNHVENWAKKRKFTLFISSRGTENKGSQKLFESCAFEQSNNTSMSKKLNY